MNFKIRKAVISDRKPIKLLIEKSTRKLGSPDYSAEQIEAALETAWGLDTQLISDQTYFVVESDNLIIGCGGWSYRETLFGNDSEKNRSSNLIEPATGAAKIRAFFVSPDFSRKGVGSMIMQKCEEEACLQGFTRLELMATLPGKRLYEKHGFIAGDSIDYPLGGHLSIKFIPMQKEIPGSK